jgi:hypothetical protein
MEGSERGHNLDVITYGDNSGNQSSLPPDTTPNNDTDPCGPWSWNLGNGVFNRTLRELLRPPSELTNPN